MAATENQIEEIERRFGVRLPDDYRHFLLTRGSMDEFLPPANAYLSLYPIDEITSVNEEADIQSRFLGAFVIGGDGSRERLTYDFRHGQSPLVLLDITADDWSAAIYQAASLTALLEELP